jgi:hypothetical protein
LTNIRKTLDKLVLYCTNAKPEFLVNHNERLGVWEFHNGGNLAVSIRYAPDDCNRLTLMNIQINYGSTAFILVGNEYVVMHSGRCVSYRDRIEMENDIVKFAASLK